MATHMKNYRKMGDIIRKIGHLEKKMGKVLGIKEKNKLNVEHNLQRPSHEHSLFFHFFLIALIQFM